MLRGYGTLIVTGASSGIGKSFVEHAVRMNPELKIFNLSRSFPAISSMSERQLKLSHIPCDFSDSGALDSCCRRLVAELEREGESGRILLINNSGYGTYGPFPEPDLTRNVGMIDVNARAPVAIVGHLLPLLRLRGGAIINVASTAAFQPTAGMAVYGASKAFLLHWSLALREELRGTGIEVLALCPGPTSTNFFRNAGLTESIVPDSFGQEVSPVVLAAYKALAGKKGLVVSGWKNKVLACVSSKLPKTMAAWLAARVIARFRPSPVRAKSS